MAADVETAETACSGTRLADPPGHPTRSPKDGYFVYDAEVDMQALAQISFPIAVQCEKLLEERYSLFDYIVRTVVKACATTPNWEAGNADVLLFENEGEETSIIPDATGKTIYAIAKETAKHTPLPADYHPRIVVCDAHTSRARVAEVLRSDCRPDFAFVTRGNSPKVGIRAGCAELGSFILSYTFYAAETAVAPDVANHIAAELHALLYNPTRLLLIA